MVGRSIFCFSVSLVLTVGAGFSVAHATKSKSIDCRARLPEALTFELLQERIELCSVRSIDELLSVFPKTHLENYTLMHEARGRQRASLDAPRAILFGRDAKLIVAFNGDPRANAYEDLELIQFRDATKTFELRSITFPEGERADLAKAEISPANPMMCLGCHRRDNPRPNWDGYILWPGAFGAEDDFIFREDGSRKNEDGRRFEAFMANGKKTARYRHLAEKLGKDAVIPNSLFGIKLNHLNMQSITRELENEPRVRPFRYALVAAVICGNEDESYFPTVLPPKVLAKAKRTFRQLVDDTEKSHTESFLLRLMRLQKLTPSAPETPRIAKYSQDGAAGRTIYGRSSAAEIAGFRLVMEEILGLPMLQWSMELPFRNYMFADGYRGLAEIETHLIEAFLKDDPKFAAILKPYKSPNGVHSRYRYPVEEVCKRLKAKSLKELANL